MDLIDSKTYAERLGISDRRARKIIRNNQTTLGAVKLGGVWLVKKGAADPRKENFVKGYWKGRNHVKNND